MRWWCLPQLLSTLRSSVRFDNVRENNRPLKMPHTLLVWVGNGPPLYPPINRHPFSDSLIAVHLKSNDQIDFRNRVNKIKIDIHWSCWLGCCSADDVLWLCMNQASHKSRINFVNGLSLEWRYVDGFSIDFKIESLPTVHNYRVCAVSSQ